MSGLSCIGFDTKKEMIDFVRKEAALLNMTLRAKKTKVFGQQGYCIAYRKSNWVLADNLTIESAFSYLIKIKYS